MPSEKRASIPIEFHKVLQDSVNINLPGPTEPTASMSGGELMHGFLAELHDTNDPQIRAFVDALCTRWGVHYVRGK